MMVQLKVKLLAKLADSEIETKIQRQQKAKKKKRGSNEYRLI